VHEHREHILSANESAVEEGESREGHHEDEHRGGDHPSGVSGVDGDFCFLSRTGESDSSESHKGKFFG